MFAQSTADQDGRLRIAVIGDPVRVRRLAPMIGGTEYAVVELPGAGTNLTDAGAEIVVAAESEPEFPATTLIQNVHRVRRSCPVLVVTEGGPRDVRRAVAGGALDAVPEQVAGPVVLEVALERVRALASVRAEHERRRNDLRRSVTMLESRNQRLLESISHLEELVRTDELTGLANRRWLNLVLEGVWAESVRNALPLGIIMLDLDRFKAVNDRYGHACGDDVLRLAARTIEANCREIDTKARLGGDEFCILLPHTSCEEVMTVANRIADEFGVAVAGGRAPRQVGISIGVAHNRIHRTPSASVLLSQADEALYRAKARGQPVVLWTSEVAQGGEAPGGVPSSRLSEP